MNHHQYVEELAKAPQSIPYNSGEDYNLVNYLPQEELTTCFTGDNFEGQFSFPGAPSMDVLFDFLETNLPQIVKLQSEKLTPGPKSYRHSGSIPVFLNMLSDPTIHLYSLCPFPNLSTLDLDVLLTHIFDSRVPPDRAAWAIHYFSIKKNIAPNQLTDALIVMNFSDYDFSVKLFYHIYTRGLLENMRFLTWLVTGDISPEYLMIFKIEIIRTHSILDKALRSKYSKKYIDVFSEILLLKRSHLIQLSLVSNPYPCKQEIDNMLTSVCQRRSKKMFDIIKLPRKSISALVYDLINDYYPVYNSEKIIPEFRNITFHLTNQDKIGLVVYLFKIINEFPSFSSGLTSTIALMVSKLEVSFPIDEYVSFLYRNIDQIDRHIFFFIELQHFKCFSYASFQKVIQCRGYFTTKPSETAIIVKNLPSYERSENHLMLFISSISRLGESTYDDVIQSIVEPNSNYPEKGIISKIDLFLTIPVSMQYGICSWVISKTIDFSLAAEVIFQSNLDILFIYLLERVNGKNTIPFGLSRSVVPRVIKMIPSIIAHEKTDIFLKALFANTQNPVCFDIILYIYDHYKDLNIFSEYKSKMADLPKIAKNPMINTNEIRSLFRKFSFLCSLHTFDAFHGVKSVNDFESIFRTFFSDLLQFSALTPSMLFDLFSRFSESQCITKPCPFFLKTSISVVLCFLDNQLTDRLRSLLYEFYSRVFNHHLFEPSTFLHHALTDSKKQKNKSVSYAKSTEFLLKILFDILQNHPNMFPISSCLTENVFKGFSPMPGSDNGLIHQYYSILSCWDPPIMSKEILRCFDPKAGTPIGYDAVLFSLLPNELRTNNFDQCFAFYSENVNSSNSTLWTLWITYRPYYSCDLPVSSINADKDTIKNHYNHIASAFYDLICSIDSSDPRSETFLNCWIIACAKDRIRHSSTQIANIALELAINDLKSDKCQVSQQLLSFLHPAMKNSDPLVFEKLCNEITKIHIPDNQFATFASVASSIFVVYISCIPNAQINIVSTISEKLIDWLLKVIEKHFSCFDVLLDTFNYFVCSTINYPNSFQEQFYHSISERLTKLPPEIQELIILNLPPQNYAPKKDPLFINVTHEENHHQIIAPLSPQGIKSNQYTTPFPEADQDDDFPWFGFP